MLDDVDLKSGIPWIISHQSFGTQQCVSDSQPECRRLPPLGSNSFSHFAINVFDSPYAPLRKEAVAETTKNNTSIEQKKYMQNE